MPFKDDFEVIVKFYVTVEIYNARVTKFSTISGLKINTFTTKTIVPEHFYLALCLQSTPLFLRTCRRLCQAYTVRCRLCLTSPFLIPRRSLYLRYLNILIKEIDFRNLKLRLKTFYICQFLTNAFLQA